MSDINKIRKLAGIAPASTNAKKLNEGTIGRMSDIPVSPSTREQTDLDKWIAICNEADSDKPQKLDEMTVGDLSNGYDRQHKANGDDYFPSGATSAVRKNAGPASAKHGDNPMQKSIKDNQKDEVHEELVHAYRNFITE